MGKAGGIIGLIAGIFAVIAALVTLAVGGVGAAFNAGSAGTIVTLGWAGLAASFLVIVFGAVAIFKPTVGAFGLLALSIIGAAVGGAMVAICLVLALLGGVLAAIGSKAEAGKRAYWPWAGAPLGIVLAVMLAMQVAKPDAAPEIAAAPAIAAPALAQALAAPEPEPVFAVEPTAPAAAAPVEPIAVAARKCEASPEPLACETEDHAAADAALNAAYKAAMARLPEGAKTALRTEQRAWIKARDKECGDAMGQARVLACEADKSIERTAEITRL